MNQEENLHWHQVCWHLDLGLPASRPVRSKCSLLSIHWFMVFCYRTLEKDSLYMTGKVCMIFRRWASVNAKGETLLMSLDECNRKWLRMNRIEWDQVWVGLCGTRCEYCWVGLGVTGLNWNILWQDMGGCVNMKNANSMEYERTLCPECVGLWVYEGEGLCMNEWLSELTSLSVLGAEWDWARLNGSQWAD